METDQAIKCWAVRCKLHLGFWKSINWNKSTHTTITKT